MTMNLEFAKARIEAEITTTPIGDAWAVILHEIAVRDKEIDRLAHEVLVQHFCKKPVPNNPYCKTSCRHDICGRLFAIEVIEKYNPEFKRIREETIELKMIECFACEGTGDCAVHGAEGPCSYCNGTGRITKDR